MATQQKVEIMKMLYRDAEILIFDEPTAVLTDQEIQGLLKTMQVFKENGKPSFLFPINSTKLSKLQMKQLF